MTTTALQEAEAKLTALLLEQKEAYDEYTRHQTGENYSRILKLKAQVGRAKSEVYKNK